MIKLLIVIMFLFSVNFAEMQFLTDSKEESAVVSVEHHSLNSVTIDLKITAIHKTDVTVNGIEYSWLKVKGLQNILEVGSPSLPVYKFDMIIPEDGKLSYEVINKESVKLKNISVHPALECRLDNGEFDFDIEPEFIKNSSIYTNKKSFPGKLVKESCLLNFRGTSLSTIQISPVQYNPVNNEIEVFTQLKVKINYAGGSFRSVARGKTNTILEKIAVNGKEVSNYYNNRNNISMRADDKYDIIVLSTPMFKEPLDELVKWQRQKGYEVLVDTRDNWDSLTIKTVVKSFYDNNDQPGYMLIFGDHDDVPGYGPCGMPSVDTSLISDIPYVIVGSDKYFPAMASGRISVSNNEEAWNVVNKILRYEKNPIDDPTFYNTFLMAAAFQDLNDDSYADRRFAETINDMYHYVIDSVNLGYTAERVFQTYYGNNVSTEPTFWNNTEFSFGEPIPEDLKKPNFPWDGDSLDIIREINEGKHIVAHRDHGNRRLWGHPRFDTANISQLENGEKTPIVFSVNCQTGQFKVEDCFAEKFHNKVDGAVGVVAAATNSISGGNDAFVYGLFDAIWPNPGIVMTSPKVENPKVEDHEPIYTIGDVILHGHLRAKASWGNFTKQYLLFHWFGDPTMEIRTGNPKTIDVSYSYSIEPGATEFTISSLNISEGIVTLYSKNKDKIVGKGEASSSRTTISLSEAAVDKDTLTHTITNHNYRPIHIDLPVTNDKVNMVVNHKVISKSVTVSLNKKKFIVPYNKNVLIQIYTLNGREIYSKQWDKLLKDKVVNIPNISTGTYVVKLKYAEKLYLENMVYLGN